MPEPYNPRPYQTIATKFILDNPHCMLAVDMGMGKTVSTLTALEILKLAGSSYFPALVLAPKQVAQTVWTGERERWQHLQHLRIEKIMGTAAQRIAALKRPVADIYIMNYDNIQWLAETLGDRWPFKIVVADESTRLKGFRLVKGAKRAGTLSKIAARTHRWINLTGTPAPNGLIDLWGQFWFLDFGKRLGLSYTRFFEKWFYVQPYTEETKMLPGAEQEIHAAVADITLALRAEDWFELEKPLHVKKYVALPDNVQKLYRKMERDLFMELPTTEDGIEAANGGVKSMKLLEMTSGSVYDADQNAHALHDAKVEALQEIVEEVHEPLLVAYWWSFDVDRIRKAFPNARVRRGPQDDADWNAGKIDMLLVHPKGAGHGLNLQHGGRNIVYYSQHWDLELQQQVFNRIGPVRQAQAGYKRVVRRFDIIARDTIDEEVIERNDTKESIQSALKKARARRPL